MGFVVAAAPCCPPALAAASEPDQRPPMRSVMVHPLWWPPPQRLAFLIQVSDRVEGEDRRVSAVPCNPLRSLCVSRRCHLYVAPKVLLWPTVRQDINI